MAFVMNGFGCGLFEPTEIQELLTICKCQLVFHTDIHFFPIPLAKISPFLDRVDHYWWYCYR